MVITTKSPRNTKGATRRDNGRPAIPAAHIEEARKQFAQTEELERAAILDSYARTIARPQRRESTREAPSSTSAHDELRHKLLNGNRVRQPFPPGQWTSPRCRLEGNRTFDNGSAPDFVKAFYEGTTQPAADVARHYSRADATIGELATILMVGHSGLSYYEHPPIDGSEFLETFDMYSVSAFVENWSYPGAKAPAYDIGMIALTELPGSIPVYATPTIDGAFGGFVSLLGSVKLEFYAWTPSGVTYDVTGSRFLDTFAAKNHSGSTSYTPTTVLSLEVQVPMSAAFMVTRVTTQLMALRVRASADVSATGGFIGAAVANPGEDPWSGIYFGGNTGRARVTLLSNTCG